MKEPLEIVPGATSVDRGPDPWGVKRAENLLQSLKGVTSSRVVVSPDGEITEIHVLTEGGLTPKQVVRNVESALLAQLGIKVDHRRISVAQVESEPKPDIIPIAEPAAPSAPTPPEAPDAASTLDPATSSNGGGAAAPAPETASPAQSAPLAHTLPTEGGYGTMSRDVLFQNVEVSSIRPNKVRVTVTLEWDGEVVSAEEDAADTPNMRLQAAARATAAALDQAVDAGTIDLIGAQFVEAFDTTFVFVGVSVLTGRDTALHTGTCEVKRGAEQAAALGVLDATNRWLRSTM